ncbi:STAS domain-containing protein [Cerasicoccus maritimus]|uniref:STAS domain-containing protein n=1 Tax=Cerasicoccus maritimus TaxID=490089 RepID=UPI002852A6A4|nr:STAS domain-containing protein [Cerasicoccus maritimus]
MKLNIDSIELSNGRITCFLNGVLDTNTSLQFDEYIHTRLSPKVKAVALDLKDLNYISSAGLRSFAKLRREMTSRGGQLVFANLSPQVEKVFDIVKAIPLREVFSSTAEMDAYLKNVQEGV